MVVLGFIPRFPVVFRSAVCKERKRMFWSLDTMSEPRSSSGTRSPTSPVPKKVRLPRHFFAFSACIGES